MPEGKTQVKGLEKKAMKVINYIFIFSSLIMVFAMDLSAYGSFSSELFFALFFAVIIFEKYAYRCYSIKKQLLLIALTVIATVFFTMSFMDKRKPKNQSLIELSAATCEVIAMKGT